MTLIRLIAVCMSLISACAMAQQRQVVKIGLTSQLSGIQSAIGIDALKGAQMAIERLNQQNLQIDGRTLKFELLARDDKASPEEGAAVARELAGAGVSAVLGSFNSGVSLSSAKIYNDAGIVNLNAGSNPRITQPALNYVFRIVANDSDMGSKMGQYAARNLKLKKIAIIDDGSPFAQGVIEAFEKSARQNGIRVVSKDAVGDKTMEFGVVLGAIRKAGVDAIFFGGYVPQAGALLKQMQQMGMSTTLLGGDALCSSTMLTHAGAALGDNTYCVQGGVWLTRVADGAVFASAYQKQYGVMPDVYAPTFYDGILLLAQAMKSANSTDPRVFAPVLAHMRYKGITALYEFDARRDMREATVTILRFKANKLTPMASF